MAAREYYAANVASEVTTTSATAWTQVGLLEFTPAGGRDYVVLWSLEATNKSSWTDDVRFRLNINGAPATAANLEMRAVGEYPSLSGFLRIVGDGLPRTITVEVQAEWAGDTVAVRNLNLAALALGAGDRYAEAPGRTVVTSDSFTTLLDMTWTPEAGGDYLLLSSCLVDNFSGTAPAYARMECGGAVAAEWPCGTPEAIGAQQSNVPHGYLWRRTLAAGATISVKWRGRTHSDGAVSGWSDVRLLALRLADFDRSAYGELAADDSGTSASYSSALDVSDTASGNPQLILANWTTASLTPSLEGAARVVDSGSVIGTSIRRTFANSISRGTISALCAVRPGAAGTRTWSLERRSDGTNAYLVRAGSALAVLDLGEAGAALAAGAAGLASAGAAATIRVARIGVSNKLNLALAGLEVGARRQYRGLAGPGAWLTGLRPAMVLASRRIGAVSHAVVLGGGAAGVARGAAGAWLVASTAALAEMGAPATPRLGRRVACARGDHAWARLNALPSYGRSLRAAAGGLAASAVETVWRHARAIGPGPNRVEVRAPAARLAYSGVQFWELTSPEPEAWAHLTPRPETWAPMAPSATTWS